MAKRQLIACSAEARTIGRMLKQNISHTLLHLAFLSLSAAALLGTGCTSPTDRSQALSQSAIPEQVELNYPPKELMNVVREVVSQAPLSMPIEEQRGGILITGWKEYRGEFHIARHWQERTRYLIRITPDFDEPLQKSRMEVTTQSEQRAASQQPWQPAPELNRTTRANEVLKQIEQAIQQRKS